jgi:YidC/Oxa1 family membrane protein insertase
MSRSSRYTTPLVASLVTSGGIRFQSTQPDKTAQLFEQIPDISPAAQGSGSIIRNATSDVFEKLSDSVQNTGTEIVPHIGMLKEAGLDFGWGFTSMAQWIIEHIHVWADMPWWAALASTALLYRTVFLWPMYHSSHNAAIGQAIAPAQREIKDRYKNMDLDNNQRMALMQQEMRYLSKKTGYSIAGHIGPIVAQGLFTFGIFRFTRNLATIPDLGLSDGGFLWLSNLHHADPYYILPVATGMTMYVMARVSKVFTIYQVTV